MASRTFVTCAKTDCRWNEDGICKAADIFVDDGVTCATYEPMNAGMGLGMDMAAGPPGLALPGGPAPMGGLPGGGPMGVDPRQLLLRRLMAGAGAGPPGGGETPPTL